MAKNADCENDNIDSMLVTWTATPRHLIQCADHETLLTPNDNLDEPGAFRWILANFMPLPI
jgi:hypothetical protein